MRPEAGLAPRRAATLAGLCAAAFLLLALPRLGDFGPTWDAPLGEYAHGEQYLGYLLTGERAYLDFTGVRATERPSHRAPHPAWPDRFFAWYEAHPFGALLSAASCKLLWDELGLVPSLQAHHLPIVLGVALLLFVIVGWAARRWGVAAGLGTALALLLSPRFLAHAFSNIKDAPEACLYAFALLAYAAAFARPGAGRFALAGALTGLALAQKPNAYFLPPQALLYWALASAVRRRRGLPALALPWRGAAIAFGAGALVWLAVSPMLWEDTAARAWQQLSFFWRRGHVAVAADPWSGLLAVLRTTPPALLLLAALGALSPRLSSDDRCLLGLGVAVPVGRTLLPGTVNFDGVRHFLEFHPFLALLAGLGAAEAARLAREGFARAATAARGPEAAAARRAASSAVATALAFALLFATPAAAVVSTWPHGVCYFNRLAGGFGGAQADGLPEASDYWASSYWPAMLWLNEHAERGASVHVPVAEHVLACAAPLRLRPDLKLFRPGRGPPPARLYVLYVLRPLFYDDIAADLEAGHVPVHELKVQGGTMARIHRLEGPGPVGRALELWRARFDAPPAAARLRAWIESRPAATGARAFELFVGLLRGGTERDYEELLALLPERLHADAAIVLHRREKR